MNRRPVDSLTGSGIARFGTTLAGRPILRAVCAVGALVLLAVPVLAPTTTPLVVAVIVVGALWLNSRRDEHTALSILFALAFLIPASLIINPLGQIGVPGLIVAALLLALWCYGRIDSSLGTDRGRQPMRIVCLVFVGVVLASYVAGQLRGLSPLEASASDASLFGQACAMGLLLFVTDTLRDIDGVTRLLRLIVAACGVLAVSALLQFLGVVDLYQQLRLPGLTFHFTEDVDALARSGFHRVQGLAGHPIEYAVVLSLAMPIALHLALTAPKGRRLRWWAMFALVAGCMPLSVSRSGVLTAAVALAVYLVSVRLRMVFNLIPFVAAGLAAMSAMVPGLLGSLRSILLPSTLSTDPSVQGRTDDYAAVFTVWHDHPLLGLGVGTYIPKLYRILDNEYLFTLATMGALGVAAELALLATGYSLARRVHRTVADPVVRSLAQAIAASIAGAAVAAFTFDAFGYKLMFVVTFSLLGAAAALWRIAVRDRAAEPLASVR
ncbi:O-antigen ligase family protein [Amycolatopsis benzoatilytica]|uniref:O-antigen ligase family protein n=1 Tax=Amycolatopsis benzoatilytica TaxID=346045 RepID=UPI00037097D6|nr:O-antigen ligase family protein [Amycolatopsis benzoatilytica]